jgi:trans-aconitate methyltransferase
MKNPWLEIPLDDYEAHMALPGVAQAPLLADILAAEVAAHAPHSVAVLGCAGGNGFDRLAAAGVERVVGVDINPAYIEQTRARYAASIARLELFAADVQAGPPGFDPVDLVFAGLLFEYVDVSVVLERIRSMLLPGGVLVSVLQLPSATSADVTPSPYVSLGALAPMMRLVPPDRLRERAASVGYREASARTLDTTAGKRLHVQVLQPVAAQNQR